MYKESECTIKDWEWISNFIPRFIMDVINYPYWIQVNFWGIISQYITEYTTFFCSFCCWLCNVVTWNILVGSCNASTHIIQGCFTGIRAIVLPQWSNTEEYGLKRTRTHHDKTRTIYPKKYAHGFVVLCFVVVMQSFIMNSHEVFLHIHQGCFAGTGAIVRLPQCQWSKPDGYGKISQRITTTKHSKAKTVCIFLGIYCTVCIIPGMFCICLYIFTFRHSDTEHWGLWV